jgi:hypothetical protein
MDVPSTDDSPTPTTSVTKRWVFRLVTLLLALLLIEGTLQFTAYWSQAFRQTLTKPELTGKRRYFRSWPLGTRPNPGFPEHDAKGFRNLGTYDTAQIVAIGDSQTYGVGQRPEVAWPQQLEVQSGWPTYSMAWSSWGPGQAVYLFHEAMKLKPKVLVVGLYSGNDLYDAFRITYYKAALRRFLPYEEDPFTEEVAAGRMPPIEERIRLISANDRHARTAMRRYRSHLKKGDPLDLKLDTPSPPPQPDVPWTWSWRTGQLATALHHQIRERHLGYRVFSFRVKKWWRRLGGTKDAWAPLDETAFLKGRKTVRFEAGNISTWLTPEYRLQGLTMDGPRLSEGFRLTCAFLRQVQTMAQEHNVDLLILCIPTKEAVFAPLVRQHDDPPPPFFEQLQQYESWFWAKMKAYLDQEGIAYVEALPRLREILKEGLPPYPSTDDGHPNEAGYHAIAACVKEDIEKRGWLE